MLPTDRSPREGDIISLGMAESLLIVSYIVLKTSLLGWLDIVPHLSAAGTSLLGSLGVGTVQHCTGASLLA